MTMKKDAYYFPHDSNAKDDPKITLLIDQLGLEGYGIFWVLIETLRDQPDYKYPLKLLPSLARKFATTHEKIKAVVSCYDLFEIENDLFFFSVSLIERMLPLEKIREQRKAAVKSRWKKSKQKELKENDTTVIRPYNDSNTGVIQRREEEKREEESKEKKTSFFEKIGLDLLNSQMWIEGIAMQNQLSFELCKKYLVKFLKEQRSKENTELEINDYKSHFVSWVKVEIKRDPIQEEIKAPSTAELLKIFNRK